MYEIQAECAHMFGCLTTERICTKFNKKQIGYDALQMTHISRGLLPTSKSLKAHN